MTKHKFLIKKELNVELRKNVLYFFNNFAVMYFVLPRVFYMLDDKGSMKFMLKGQKDYKLMLNSLLKMYKNIHYFYFFRLKLKGLGFRLSRLCDKLYMMFFGAYNFVYLHINMLTFTRGRNIIVIDNDKKLLNTIFYQLLNLKRMDLYSKKKNFL